MAQSHYNCVTTSVHANQRQLVAMASSILGNLEPAKLAVRKALVRLAKQDCASIENLQAWLFRACGKEISKARRRRAVFRPEVFWQNLTEDRAEEGSDNVRHRDCINLLLSRLDELPEDDAEVIRLFYMAGLEVSQVVEVLGLRANRVHQLHFAGLVGLRRLTSAEQREESAARRSAYGMSVEERQAIAQELAHNADFSDDLESLVALRGELIAAGRWFRSLPRLDLDEATCQQIEKAAERSSEFEVWHLFWVCICAVGLVIGFAALKAKSEFEVADPRASAANTGGAAGNP